MSSVAAADDDRAERRRWALRWSFFMLVAIAAMGIGLYSQNSLLSAVSATIVAIGFCYGVATLNRVTAKRKFGEKG
jgi:hypothetical protein